MVELADTLDLGSSGFTVQVQVLLPAPQADSILCIYASRYSHLHAECESLGVFPFRPDSIVILSGLMQPKTVASPCKCRADNAMKGVQIYDSSIHRQ